MATLVLTIVGLGPGLEGYCQWDLLAVVALAVDVDFSEPLRLVEQELGSWESEAGLHGDDGRGRVLALALLPLNPCRLSNQAKSVSRGLSVPFGEVRGKQGAQEVTGELFGREEFLFGGVQRDDIRQHTSGWGAIINFHFNYY